MKDKIVEALKFFVFAFSMTMIFYFIYALMWISTGLPLNDYIKLVLVALSVLSTLGSIKWADKGEQR